MYSSDEIPELRCGDINSVPFDERSCDIYSVSFEKGEKIIALSHPTYDYSSDEEIKLLIAKLGKVYLYESYNGHINWLPFGTFNIIVYGEITKPIVNIPPTIKTIEIVNDNFSLPIDNLQSIESLVIKSQIFNQTPEHIPPTCKNVEIISKAFNYPLDCFPDTVETISLDMFDIANTSKIPKSLKTLNLENSLYSTKTLKAFQAKFPTIQIIYKEFVITSRQLEFIKLTGRYPDDWPKGCVITSRQLDFIKLTGRNPEDWPIDVEIK